MYLGNKVVCGYRKRKNNSAASTANALNTITSNAFPKTEVNRSLTLLLLILIFTEFHDSLTAMHSISMEPEGLM